MDFALSEEQGFIRDTIRKFIAKECDREKIKKMEEEGEFPQGLFQTVAQMGFCALTIPESYGGGGPDALGAALVAQELATIYPVLAGIYTSSALCGGFNITQLASDEQKERYLPEIAQGKLLFTYAIEEPGAAYGLNRVKTTAEKDGEGYVINGTKTFVRLAERADYILTLVSTRKDEDPRDGLTIFLLDAKTPGITVNPLEKVGFDSSTLCDVVFDAVKVPKEAIVGGPEKINQGWDQYTKLMAARHLEIAILGVGIAKGAYEYAAQYAKEREQFGRPIAHFGSVKCMLVDMAIKINAARNLLYQACWLADTKGSFLAEAIMARICASQAARSASMDCVQILGGYGYANEYDAQRYLRDSLVLFEGNTTEEEIKDSLAGLLKLI